MKSHGRPPCARLATAYRTADWVRDINMDDHAVLERSAQLILEPATYRGHTISALPILACRVSTPANTRAGKKYGRSHECGRGTLRACATTAVLLGTGGAMGGASRPVPWPIRLFS